MTDREKQQIMALRQSGISYTQISDMLNISINSIKSYCKRHNFGGKKALLSESSTVLYCEHCGMPVKQNAGRKTKRFCSDKCRMLWWNGHTELVKRKANYTCTCQNCGKEFISYGNKNRKYCSHECYIEDRFGGAC